MTKSARETASLAVMRPPPSRLGLLSPDGQLVERLRRELAYKCEAQLLVHADSAHAAADVLSDRLLALDALLVDMDMMTDEFEAAISSSLLRNGGPAVLLLAQEEDDPQAARLVLQWGAGCVLKDAKPHHWIQAVCETRDGGCPLHPKLARALVASWRTRAVTLDSTGSGSLDDDVHLSRQEALVLHLCSRGLNYGAIAQSMKVSRHTVLTYVRRCFKKLGANSKTHALYEARKRGLMTD